MQVQFAEKNTFLVLSATSEDIQLRRTNTCAGLFCTIEDVPLPTMKKEYAPRFLCASKTTDSTPSTSCSDTDSVTMDPWKKLDEFVEDHSLESNKWTTVMIRNIPNKYSQDKMLEVIRETGCAVNFLHVPLVNKSRSNVGYAFANFTTPQEALKFMNLFDGHRFKRQQRAAAVNYARLQGLEENIAFFESRRIVKTDRKPWTLDACLN
jgi:hypothetical protein